MADLATRGLAEIRRDLELVLDELRNAHPRAYGLANAIGYGEGALHEVKEKIRDFERTWNNRRDELVEGADAVVRVVAGIYDVFAELDTRLTQALEGDEKAAQP